MKSRIVKSYTGWVNEATEPTAPAAASQAVDGISFVSASASASNITDQLAATIGIKKDTVYTLTMNNIALLRFVDTDGSKFGGTNAQSRITINLDSTQKTAKPGDDVLEINGKKILETGTIFLKKTELTGQVTITAANNGMLTLVRFANALADMATRQKFYLGNCQNFVLKFALGNPKAEADSRGFSYYWAQPGKLNYISNAIAAGVSINLLNTLGLQDSIATSDPVFSTYFNQWVSGKDAAAATTAIAKGAAGFVKSRNMLINDQIPELGAAWTGLGSADFKTLVQYDERSKKFKLLPEGAKRLNVVFNKIAESIAPTKAPVNFGNEGTEVFTGYADIIKTGLATVARNNNITHWFDLVQQVHDWQKGSTTPAPGGSGGKNQGEGQVGRS
jgi:hypothetical protein